MFPAAEILFLLRNVLEWESRLQDSIPVMVAGVAPLHAGINNKRREAWKAESWHILGTAGE